jgi:hypothetical protein
LLCRSKTRINLLFTMSEIPHAHPVGRNVRSDVSRTIIQSSLSIFNSIWWSQTGSNRRPHACKARALPAELWPRTRRRTLYADERRIRSIKVVGLGRLELPTSRLSSARSNQLSYKPPTRGACERAPVRTRCIAQAQPLARVRPRRKRNEDGEIPPMELNNLAIVGP